MEDEAKTTEARQAWVDTLAGDDGWFHEDGKAAVLDVLGGLTAAGIAEDQARDMIECVVVAIRSEYGE